MKRLTILCALALSLSLLAGCSVTSPEDEEFQRDWADSMDKAAEDFEAAWDGIWDDRDEDGVEKDHYWTRNRSRS